MKRLISAVALLSVATLLGVAGCGGDDDDAPKNSGGTKGSGEAGEPSSNAGEPGSGGTSGNGNLGCDKAADTACQNETDCPFVVDGTARKTAQTCGKGECLGSKDAECARKCIQKTLDLSNDCSDCYGAFVKCTIDKCVGDCISDPDADVCHTCQETEGCRPTFNTCSGLPE